MTRNLIKIFDSLNSEFFNNEVCAGIAWRKVKLGEKKVTLGSCNTAERFIRINAVLKNNQIPLWFLKYIVYHEMIHALQGPREDEHNPEFKVIEKQYPDYDRAREFELTKLPKILTLLRKSS